MRFEWGLQGAEAVATGADVAVVIDVLSFTTTLSVAIDNGTAVLHVPMERRDGSALRARQRRRARSRRSRADCDQPSLSPASLRRAAPPARLVVPSPNGATIAHWFGVAGVPCVGACLRNAAATARWLGQGFVATGKTIAVIAAGERWDDGSLRPAVEDLWGAGAVIGGLSAFGSDSCSPEGAVAAAAYDTIRGRELDALLSCTSGRELSDAAYRGDVEIAAEVDGSTSVPLLVDGRFVAASAS